MLVSNEKVRLYAVKRLADGMCLGMSEKNATGREALPGVFDCLPMGLANNDRTKQRKR